MPPDHPARDMQDTFYLEGEAACCCARTPRPAQIHYMLENEHPPDVRIICPGKVFRRDSDVTHSPMFQQIEGLVVGAGIHLGHLKGTIEAFLHALFGEQYPVRFRASYFPYTEPSVEADLGCVVCGGSGRLPAGPCRICKATGWLEILGSGMVNPAVFEAVNARLGPGRLRPRGGHRLRLRPRHRARGDGPPRHRRHPPVLRERPALPGAVRRMKVPLSLAARVRPLRGRAAQARRGPDRRRPRGGRDRDRGRGDRPRARHHHEPRRLHERPRRGPRGGGPLRPGRCGRSRRRSSRRARRPRRRSTSRSRPPTCAAASARASST